MPSTARNTRVAAVELRDAMQTAESSQRGFIITGNEIYLAPYQAAKIQAQRHLAALQTLLFQSYPAFGSNDVGPPDRHRWYQVRRTRPDDRAQAGSARPRCTGRVSAANSGKALMDEANVFFSGIIGTGGQPADVRRRRAARQFRMASAGVRGRRARHCGRDRRRRVREHALHEGASRYTRSGQQRSMARSSSASPLGRRIWRKRGIAPKCCCRRSITGSPTA